MFKELEKKLKAKLKKEQNELVSATTQLTMKGIDYIMEVNFPAAAYPPLPHEMLR